MNMTTVIYIDLLTKKWWGRRGFTVSGLDSRSSGPGSRLGLIIALCAVCLAWSLFSSSRS